MLGSSLCVSDKAQRASDASSEVRTSRSLSFSSARLSSDSVRNSRAETARSSSTLQMGPRSLSATSQCLGELSGAEENSTAETDSALAPNSDNMSMAVPVTETVQQMTRRRRTSFVPRPRERERHWYRDKGEGSSRFSFQGFMCFCH